MQLPTKGFNHTIATCLCNGKATEVDYYTYKSKEILYDVLIVNGTKLYNINSKATVNNCKYPVHKMIEKHFSI
jgi:hypothetical protein